MQFEAQIIRVGGSMAVVIPADLCKYLNLIPKDSVIIQDENGKHGNFISLWKKGIA